MLMCLRVERTMMSIRLKWAENLKIRENMILIIIVVKIFMTFNLIKNSMSSKLKHIKWKSKN